ncbi:MAG: hypothetical protein ACRDF0_06555 [Candidatus Limnocylindria bacterium]
MSVLRCACALIHRRNPSRQTGGPQRGGRVWITLPTSTVRSDTAWTIRPLDAERLLALTLRIRRFLTAEEQHDAY